MIELLVAIIIIVILTALIISAVQSARGAARKALCSNNLRQMTLALNGYANSNGVYPQTHNGMGYSPHVVILPFLEQTAAFSAINFNEKSGEFATPPNRTVSLTTFSFFLCPSDQMNHLPYGMTNYAGNRGYGYSESGVTANNGLFTQPVRSTSVAVSGVTDGTSTTVAFSEYLVGPGEIRIIDEFRSIFVTPHKSSKITPLDQFVAHCRSLNINAVERTPILKGSAWMFGDLGHTIYNHNMMINERSCTNGGLIQQGSWSAGSLHSGGAFSAFADGHVQFVRESVDLVVWRALSSRNGGETVEDY
jgi:prepilin-type processing-associated H-X9-DG protein